MLVPLASTVSDTDFRTVTVLPEPTKLSASVILNAPALAAWSTVKVVARLDPAFRDSMLVSVVLVRSMAVPLLTRESLPLLPATVPPVARSA